LFPTRSLFRNLKYGAVCLSILATLAISATGQAPVTDASHPSPKDELAAREEVNIGVQAYKDARYNEAIGHFRKATNLDPGSSIAKKYLATAISQTIVPGLDTPANLKTAQQAIDIFLELLTSDPHDAISMKQLAAVYFSIKNFDEAKAWQRKVLDEDPKAPEAAYTIGVVDWTQAHQNALKALQSAGFEDDGKGNADAPATAMEKIKTQNTALVEEGLKYLQQAVDNRPNYEDAMAYINLLYRRKADLDWGNDPARKNDIATAEEWRARAIATRKVNEE
jgi:tetratricopeptide (TPR) repeat protein